MLECDLIMKGGVTSGVAYPGAIVQLARRYRLRHIGGTSAGAIAAVLAAAAEYRRQHDTDDPEAGFRQLADIGPALGKDLASLFQPVPCLRALYDTVITVAQAPPSQRRTALLRGVASAWAVTIAIAAVPGAAILIGADGGWGKLTGMLLLLILPVIFVALDLVRLVVRELPRHDFGLCTGLTSEAGRRENKSAFTDWIHQRIQAIAGRREGEGPLTIGNLGDHGIQVASMTTDLASGRPWQLPLRASVHHFSRAEFDTLFPSDVVDWLVEKGGPSRASAAASPVDPAAARSGELPSDLHRLPDGGDMPLLVLARLSLAFPGLVTAVPLYRAEDGSVDPAPDEAPLRRCLFSDGGISSNFPVHFFDGFLPSRPTFGIGFVAFDAQRHGSDDSDRVHLPTRPPHRGGAIRPIDGIGSFLGAIVNTAKDWQDTLQSRLAGYAERIVEIRLDPAKEGGLHIDMPPATIARLVELGEMAAARIERDFEFDEHRLRRALVLFATLEDALAGMADAYAGTGESGSDYEQVLRAHASRYFDEDEAWREDPLAVFGRALARIGEDVKTRRENGGRSTVGQGRLPPRDADMRLVASPDTSPTGAGAAGGAEGVEIA